MKRPENFDELRQQAIQEMNAKVCELQERIDALKNFQANMDATDTWDFATYNNLTSGIEDYGDEKSLKTLFEILNNWPEVAMPPGAGYW